MEPDYFLKQFVWNECTPVLCPVFTGIKLQQLDFVAKQYKVSAYTLRKVYMHLVDMPPVDEEPRIAAFFNAYEQRKEETLEKQALKICKMLKRVLDSTHNYIVSYKKDILEVAMYFNLIEPLEFRKPNSMFTAHQVDVPYYCLQKKYEIRCSIAFLVVNLMILELYFHSSTVIRFLDGSNSRIQGKATRDCTEWCRFDFLRRDELIFLDTFGELLYQIYGYIYDAASCCNIEFEFNLRHFLEKDTLPLWNSFLEPDSVANLISIKPFVEVHNNRRSLLRCNQMEAEFSSGSSIWMHPYFFMIQKVDFSSNNRTHISRWLSKKSLSPQLSFDINLKYIVEEENSD